MKEDPCEQVAVGYEADEDEDSWSRAEDDDNETTVYRANRCLLSCGTTVSPKRRRTTKKRAHHFSSSSSNILLRPAAVTTEQHIDFHSVSHMTTAQFETTRAPSHQHQMFRAPLQNDTELLEMQTQTNSMITPVAPLPFSMAPLEPSSFTKKRRLSDDDAYCNTPFLSCLSSGSILRQGALHISTQNVCMEEALSLSSNAHLIMEAVFPYRVIHANAAFHMLSLPATAMSQSDDESCKSTSDNGASLSNAVVGAATTTTTDMAKNHHRIVTLYPVCATGETEPPRHYLVELSMEKKLFVALIMDQQPAFVVA